MCPYRSPSLMDFSPSTRNILRVSSCPVMVMKPHAAFTSAMVVTILPWATAWTSNFWENSTPKVRGVYQQRPTMPSDMPIAATSMSLISPPSQAKKTCQTTTKQPVSRCNGRTPPMRRRIPTLLSRHVSIMPPKTMSAATSLRSTLHWLTHSPHAPLR